MIERGVCPAEPVDRLFWVPHHDHQSLGLVGIQVIEHRPLMTIGILELIDQDQCVCRPLVADTSGDLGRVSNNLVIVGDSEFV